MLELCTRSGFSVDEFAVRRPEDSVTTVVVTLHLMGKGLVTDVVAALAAIDGVLGVDNGLSPEAP